ncbi:hypothetical protein [Candidatus Accumulibacter vicinus]|uniref:Uncharacterized protein n=1 Tax=Candidatus Accumulibacter vicinus TaxID=2954382 RepID=A0A084XW02_9PROT|nr:hypothetical protein [Candidatus Accumulibacter vicinus]KFB66646.1 MAG: hypothetical protein CAPSK01_004011 [Candidatus Accumulibacter vicinus]
MNLNFQLGEASTKRGLALVSASILAIVQMAPTAGSVTALLARPEFWLSAGGLISGLIGMFVSDVPP